MINFIIQFAQLSINPFNFQVISGVFATLAVSEKIEASWTFQLHLFPVLCQSKNNSFICHNSTFRFSKRNNLRKK